MYCTNCGKQAISDSKFCIHCGSKFESPQHAPTVEPVTPPVKKPSIFQKINKSALAKVLVGVVIIGSVIYSTIDDQSIETNNDALNSLNSGNNADAISQLQSASQGALSDENKLNTLKNLAYAYATDGDDIKSLASFKEALPYADQNSFDYNLIMGEISYLEGKPSLAKQYYEKAYAMNNNDFQINNALALFYLDVEEKYPQYADIVKGLELARKAHSLNNTQMTLGNLGVALVINEKYQEAITYLNQINIQQHPYINLWLGFSYAGLDNPTKAKYYFQQYINTGAEVPPEVTEYINSY